MSMQTIGSSSANMWTTITLEGVLARSTNHLASAPELEHGVLVYRALCAAAPVILLCDNLDSRVVDHWLRTHGLRSHTRVVLGVSQLTPGLPTRMRQVNRIRSSGTPIRLAIDSDTLICEHLTATGIPTMHLSTPGADAVLDKRSSPRTWSEMVPDVDGGRCGGAIA